MSQVRSAEELEVFKKGHILTLKIYKTSKNFPVEERFSLTPQIRRAAASICTNLMEGSHRLGRKEFRQFVGIAKGSAGELKYHLLIAKDLGYISGDEYLIFRSQADEISKMLSGLIKSLSGN